MKLIFLKNFIKKFINKNSSKGFTFLEFILAISLLGITSSIAIPLFKNGINKSKQKEASLIVSSMIKGAKSKYAISANLPVKMGDLAKFSNFDKCDIDEVETKGDLVCKDTKPIRVGQFDTSFFSPSGNYKIDLKTENIDNKGEMFMVKANPNGRNFSSEGSSVIGCYSPISGVTIIKEYSSKNNERGEKPYITCGLKTDIARGPPKPGCTNPEAINYNPEATVDDGSCIFKCPPGEICGCTNPEALNYNPEATVDDGSCIIKTNPPNREKNLNEKKSSKAKAKSKREDNNIKNQNSKKKGLEFVEKVKVNIKTQEEEAFIFKANERDRIEKINEEKEKINSPIPPWIR